MSTKTLEFIEAIFSSISEDNSIPHEIKPYLMGLQIPVIKASEDTSFFSDTSHPARITLQLLTKMGRSEKDIRGMSLNISRITDELIHESNITTKNFIIANRKLLVLLSNSQKSELIKKYEKKYLNQQNKNKKSHFKQLVITELQEIISDNNIPILAHEITLKIWPQFMYKKCVAHGANSTHWIESIDKFKNIIDFLQPIKNIRQWYQVNDSYEQFVQSVSLLLNDSDINKQRISFSVDALNKAINKNLIIFRDKNLNQFKDSVDEMSIDKESAALTAEDKVKMLPKYVKVGEWYDLFTSEECAANRLKLSLIVENQAQLIFVDHRGIRGMVKDADVFSEELSNFLSRPVSSKRPKFVDTWNDLIEKIPNFNRKS